MPFTISNAAQEEKNKLTSTGVWLVLLEFGFEDQNVRVCYNTEDITWNGFVWKAFPFELDEIEESSEGELPTFGLTVADVTRELTPILDANDGGIGVPVIVRVVHSEHLDINEPEFKEIFEIVDCTIDSNNNVKFSLGSENFTNYRSPRDRYLKGHCRYEEFKGTLCGYSGTETECNRTWERCKELGNQERFGGFPGVGRIGFFT